MSTYVWLVIWAVVIVTVAAVYVRERRSGRPEVAEFDRNDHEAVREASVNLGARGPNGPSSTFMG
jgi:beta-lactamase regulating signal transducer with metallopeptidase domain